jgi:hypothetical protein
MSYAAPAGSGVQSVLSIPSHAVDPEVAESPTRTSASRPMTSPSAVAWVAGGKEQISPPRNAALGVTPGELVPEPVPLKLTPLAPGHSESVSLVAPESDGSPALPATTTPQFPPSVAIGVEQMPEPGSHVPTRWHASIAVHVTGLEPTQVPAVQVSVRVHALPSLQAVPFAAVGFEHTPVVVLQLPATWHVSLAAHVTALPPAQVPLWHVSLFVQAFPSLHDVPFGAAGFEHAPVDASHVPATWHVSLGVHVTRLPPVHVPLWHVSAKVHAFPSLHVVPFAAVGFEHAPVVVLHAPAT